MYAPDCPNGVQSDPEGSLWRDPPHYVEAHSEIFDGGDIESGEPTGRKVGDLVLIKGLEMEMSDVVDKCCAILIEEVKR
jgi:nicotinamide/nicotinate riboside kinase